MIRRVRIQGYKSIQDVEIHFGPLMVVFGPNAAGKSNLLDALALLSRMVTSRTLQEAFERHRGTPLEAFHYGSMGLRGLLQQERAQLGIEIDVELSPSVVREVEQQIDRIQRGLSGEDKENTRPRQQVPERLLRYRVIIEIIPRTGSLRVVNEEMIALTPNREEKDPQSRKPFIYRVEKGLLLRTERQARLTIYPIGLDHLLVSQPLSPPHYPHITAFREELARWRFYHFDPQGMRKPFPLKEANDLGPFGEDLAVFYHTLRRKNREQFDDVLSELQKLIPSVEQINTQLTPDGFVELSVVENGVPHSARVVSDGALRLLGLLAATNPLSPVTLIGYEEPENSIPSHLLPYVANLLKDTARRGVQIVVNTHSPLFLECFDQSALVECKREAGSTLLKGIVPGSTQVHRY